MTKPKKLLVAFNPMAKIVQSPYEASGTSMRSAEVDERVFEKVKPLFEPVVIGKGTGVSSEAIKVFGLDLASKLADTRHGIHQSGMVYSQEWTSGVIKEKNVGKVGKDYLVLLLSEQRLANSKDMHSLIVKDLDLIPTLLRALASWKLTKRYPRVAKCKGISSRIA
ncbi:MAG: hypothetical protein SGARI_004189 [Bacillariaceae sp.]